MTDELEQIKAPPINDGMRNGCTATPEEAFDEWLKLDKKNAVELHAVLEAKGHTVSVATCQKWQRLGRWHETIGIEPEKSGNRTRRLLQELQEDAELLTSDTLTGFSSRIIAKCSDSLKNVVIESPDDLVVMVSVMEQLKTASHEKRGEAITKGEPGESKAKAGPILELTNWQAEHK